MQLPLPPRRHPCHPSLSGTYTITITLVRPSLHQPRTINVLIQKYNHDFKIKFVITNIYNKSHHQRRNKKERFLTLGLLSSDTASGSVAGAPMADTTPAGTITCGWGVTLLHLYKTHLCQLNPFLYHNTHYTYRRIIHGTQLILVMRGQPPVPLFGDSRLNVPQRPTATHPKVERSHVHNIST